MSNESQTMQTIDLETLETVQGGFWGAAALTGAASLFGAGFSKGNGKGHPWRAAGDVVDPRNKANWPRVLPVVGGVYSAGRLFYKGGEFLGRS